MILHKHTHRTQMYYGIICYPAWDCTHPIWLVVYGGSITCLIRITGKAAERRTHTVSTGIEGIVVVYMDIQNDGNCKWDKVCYTSNITFSQQKTICTVTVVGISNWIPLQQLNLQVNQTTRATIQVLWKINEKALILDRNHKKPMKRTTDHTARHLPSTDDEKFSFSNGKM